MQDEPTEYALKIGLHVQEFEAQHLRLKRDWMGTTARGDCLIDEVFGLRRLLGYDPHGALNGWSSAPKHHR